MKTPQYLLPLAHELVVDLFAGGNSPDVLPRLPLTNWLLMFSLWLFDAVARTSPVEDDGAIPILITGKLKESIKQEGGET